MSDTRTIATLGEILVEFVSHQRTCALEQIADYSGPYPSGAPAIFLDQAARMGAPTEMIGGVGNDGFGRCILERLQDDAAMDAIREVMERSYCLLPSTSDLEFLYPDVSEEAAIDSLLKTKAEVIAIKRGADGATVARHGERHDFAGHHV